jgi:hypothetical protein
MGYRQTSFRIEGPSSSLSLPERLLEIFDIKGNRSTSHHPQTDGQTERVNQTLEQYLRVYCDYQQDDWHFLLPLAEFVYNNMENSSTKTSPFFAMYGTHPKCTLTIVEESNNPRAEDFAKQIEDVRAVLKANLKTAQEQYKRSYDKHAIAAPNFQVEIKSGSTEETSIPPDPRRSWMSNGWDPFG